MLIGGFEKIQSQIGYSSGINGKNEFFNSVVLVLLIPINSEYHFVFPKRAQNSALIKVFPNYIDEKTGQEVVLFPIILIPKPDILKYDFIPLLSMLYSG